MIKMDVKLSGPLFSGSLPQKVGHRLDDTSQELADKGKDRLRELLQKGGGGVFKESTGNYREHIALELRVDHEVLLTDGGIVYGPWLEGTSSRNQSTRFKGYHVFRQVGDWLDEQAKVILDKHAGVLVRDLD
jgi:hypothetical protein